MDERNELEDHQLSDMITFLLNWNDYMTKPADGGSKSKFIDGKGAVAFNQIESALKNLRAKPKQKQTWQTLVHKIK